MAEKNMRLLDALMKGTLGKKVSKDNMAGFAYALSTLETEEQQVLQMMYGDNMSYEETAEKMVVSEDAVLLLEKEAFRKLRLPGRWNYIRYGVVGYLRLRLAQERSKAYHAGYYDGYRRGQEQTHTVPDSVLDMPLEMLGLSYHAQQCLLRMDMKTVGDFAGLEEDAIRRIRGMGQKTAAEIARALRRHGVVCTLWDKFHMEEE